MRKMSSIRRVDSIVPIAGADAIECAVIGGWSLALYHRSCSSFRERCLPVVV